MPDFVERRHAQRREGDRRDTDGLVMREVRRMPGDPFRAGDGDPAPNDPGQRQRRGIPNNGIPSEKPAWTILWADGETDSRDYLPEAFDGDVGCGVIMYHDEDGQTQRLWGYSWYAFFPEAGEDHDAERWLAMDSDDLAARQAKGETMVGLLRGLLVADEVFDRVWYRALTHRTYHEIEGRNGIREDMRESDWIITPARRQILRDMPNFNDRFVKDGLDRWDRLWGEVSPPGGAARNDGVQEDPLP